MGFGSFKFGSGSSLPSASARNTRWKPEKGKYRVSFVAMTGLKEGNPDFSDSSTIDAPNCNRIYIPNVGYVIDQGAEFRNRVGAEKEGRPYYCTTIVLWPVNLATGKVNAERLKSGEFEVKNFVIGERKMEQLVALHEEYPLHQFDVKIDSVGDQFKNMTFSPCRDSVFKTLSEQNESLYRRVVETAQVVSERMTADLARDMTADQVLEKLNGGSFGGSDLNLGSPDRSLSLGSNVDDILDNVLDDD